MGGFAPRSEQGRAMVPAADGYGEQHCRDGTEQVCRVWKRPPPGGWAQASGLGHGVRVVRTGGWDIRGRWR